MDLAELSRIAKLKRDPRLDTKPKLVLYDRILLQEGRWNGNIYPREELKPLVPILNRKPDTPESRNSDSLFVGAAEDHQDSTGTWVGRVKGGYYWDDRAGAIRAKRLEFVDEKTARDIAYQLEDGISSFGISPRLEVRRDGDICRDILVKSWGVVLNPAGGEDLFLASDDAEYDDRDGRRIVKNLFMDITKGKYSKGDSEMDLSELMEVVNGIRKDLDEVKKGKDTPGTPPEGEQSEQLTKADIASIVSTSLAEYKKREEEEIEAAKKKEEEEEMASKMAAVDAHLANEKHDVTLCKICLAEKMAVGDPEDKQDPKKYPASLQEGDEGYEAKKAAEDAKKQAAAEEDMAGKKKVGEEEMATAANNNPGQYAAGEQPGKYYKGQSEPKLAVVPFAPRKFDLASLDAKNLSRFGEDFLEAVKPLSEKETLTAVELEAIVSNVDRLLLAAPHEGPDPKVLAEMAEKQEKEEKELAKLVDQKAKEIAKREIQKLSAPAGRRGSSATSFVPGDAPAAAPRPAATHPADKLGSILDRTLVG